MNVCACGCGTELLPYTRTVNQKGMVKGEYPTWARGHHTRSRWVPCGCGCGKKVRGLYAHGHHKRVETYGANWKGGRSVNSQGYVTLRLPTHPNANGAGRVFEHRYVMECHLRRLLTADESVHHINGDPADNRIENLQLRKRNHGQGQKFECLDCGSHNVVAVEL